MTSRAPRHVRRFDELTNPEIAAALARSPRVILPMGSVEQHGPHLPTGTDFFAATAIALEVAGHLDALVLPLCPLGVTPMHMPYPGTVSTERYAPSEVSYALPAATRPAMSSTICSTYAVA